MSHALIHLGTTPMRGGKSELRQFAVEGPPMRIYVNGAQKNPMGRKQVFWDNQVFARKHQGQHHAVRGLPRRARDGLDFCARIAVWYAPSNSSPTLACVLLNSLARLACGSPRTAHADEMAQSQLRAAWGGLLRRRGGSSDR
jgi:hypothetical protein